MMKIMKNFLPFIFSLALAQPLFAAHRDTIYFTYNATTAELKMKVPSLGSGRYPFFYASQNSFSKRLFSKGKDTGCVTGDFLSGAFIQSRDPQTFAGVDDFDSLDCAQLEVFVYESEVLENERIAVSVAVERTAALAQSETDATTRDTKEGKNRLVIVVIAIVLLLVVGLVVTMVFRRRKKEEEARQPHTKTSSLEVVEVVKNDQLQGLDFIKKNASAYFHIDLRKDYADTAVHSVYIHHTAVKKMYDFFKQSLVSGDVTNETGCYFVGCWEYATPDRKSYNISLEQIVEPGDDLEPGEFSFNFGLKIGVKLNSAIEKLSHDTGRDYVHTVWMHSHPGLGLFLSSHDLVVQRQLAYSDAKNRLVAFVVDTNTPDLDLAVFSAKSDGTMNNKEDLTKLYSLENLYIWCRKAHALGNMDHEAVESNVAPIPVDLDKYHALQVNHQGNSRTLNVYLGSSVINAIDDILYDFEGKHSLAGYLYGKKDSRGNVVVNEILKTPSDELPLGLFIVDDVNDYEILKNKYFKDSSATCLFIGRGSDELMILTRESADKPFPPLSDAAICSMRPMKEWLRRKRVYK